MTLNELNRLNYEKIQEQLTSYIANFTQEKPVLIGLSGGIDSSLMCKLAANAIGADKVKALIMTNTRFSRQNLENARNYAHTLGISYEEFDSSSMREALIARAGINESDIIKSASVDARICDTILKTVASAQDRIYLGTINGTERLTGWYPKGTLVGDVCPLGGTLKEQIKRLAKVTKLEHLVETISQNGKQICSGCGELPSFEGIAYETMDRVLYLYETTKPSDLAMKLNSAQIPLGQASKILQRIEQVKHKQDVFPDYCKIN